MSQPLSERITIPQRRRYESVEDSEGEFLAELIAKNQCGATLEIGLAHGLSAAYILGAHKGEHVAMDPFQRAFDDRGLRNLEQLGLSDRLRFHEDFSRSVLPKLLDAGDKFDFVFIDGSHRFDDVFLDFYYCDRLLKQGGYIAFHDTWMRSTQTTLSFIRRNRTEYSRIKPCPRNLAVVQKLGRDERSLNHFKEFYTFKSLIRHWFIARSLR